MMHILQCLSSLLHLVAVYLMECNIIQCRQTKKYEATWPYNYVDIDLHVVLNVCRLCLNTLAKKPLILHLKTVIFKIKLIEIKAQRI